MPDEVARAAQPRRPSLRQRAEYALFLVVTRACLALGWPRGLRAAERLGRWFYRVTGVRRDVVHANLRRAFPDRDTAWIRRTAAACYAHLAREAVVLVHYARLSHAEVGARCQVHGIEALRTAIAEGKGAVIATGHFGNWELGGHALVARGLPADAVVQRQKNPLFDEQIRRLRERLGGVAIDRRVAARAALRSLRRGRAVLFVIDQNAGRSGAFVPFFGHLASTHRGAALLALRTGAPMFGMRTVRLGDDRYELRLERMTAPRTGDPEAAAGRLTAEFTAWLEQEIRSAPEQYFWLHKRWKSRPPGDASPGTDSR